MGNFGKRILITFLGVLIVVVLAVGGNAIQQRDKSHKVSNTKEVVYSGTYNGLDYKITKGDVWQNILYSSPMSTVSEMIDRKLLASFIENANDATKLADKRNYLIYNTNDEETIAKIQANAEQNAKLIKSFENRLTVLGYQDNGREGHTIDDYLKLMIAYDDYAAYRINEGLNIGTLTPELSDESLTKAYKDGKKDTIALTIRFNNTDEAKSIYEKFNLAVVGSRLRYYVGNEKYVVAKDSDGSYYINDDFSVDYYTMDVKLADESTKTVKVPAGNIKMTDGEYVWDNNRTAWTIDGDDTEYHFVLDTDVYDDETQTYTTEGSFTSTAKAFDDETVTFSTANTAVLSPNTWMILYLKMYNEVYSQTRTLLPVTPLTEADFYEAMGLDNTSGKISDADKAKLNEALKAYGLVLVDYTKDSVDYQEIRKYVGDSEYVLKVEDGEVQGAKNGFVTEYKQFNETNIPNYKIKTDENGNPVLDSNDKFQYELDENGEKVPNDSKKSIKDQTTFDLTNTIECNQISLYAAYFNMYNDYSYENWTSNYKTLVEAVNKNLLYNYTTTNKTRSALATQIFTTLTFDESATGGFLAQATSMTVGSDTYYYLVMKLGSSVITEDPSAEKLAELKADKVKEYLETSGVTTTAMAELRKEAGLQLFDEFLGYDYKSTISNNSQSNTYGPTDTKDYYKVKAYNAKKLARTTKEVTVNGNKVAKFTITADDLYDFAMAQSATSYIATTSLNKVLLTMDDFVKIHGKSTNYLTSKNWKMVEYAEATQNYNYYYEYYASMYKQYGYDYYDSVNEFLYAYGSRNFDDMVLSFERGTMRNIFIYNALVGDLFASNADGSYATVLSSYATDSTDPTGATTDKYLFHSEKFTDLFDKYFDINVSHVLIGVDYDEDGTPDDYNKFLETFDETTGESEFLRKADQTKLTLTEYNAIINKLTNALYDFIDEDENWSSTTVSDLSNFVDEYKKSSIVDGDYAEYKKLGITVKYESLGEVTPSNKTNYVKEFQDGIDEVYEKLSRIDKELLGYSISDSLTKSEFGLHLIVETAASNYDKATFKYTDDNYGEALKNDNDNISDAQLAMYILQKVYTNIFGDTDNPEEKAGFNYPTLPQSVTKAISLYYSSYIDAVLDTSNTYHSNYIMLLTLANESSDYQGGFKDLLGVYYSVLFGELA